MIKFKVGDILLGYELLLFIQKITPEKIFILQIFPELKESIILNDDIWADEFGKDYWSIHDKYWGIERIFNNE